MADSHKRDPEPLADDAVGSDGPGAGMPRWVKVTFLVGLALVLLFVLAQVTGVAGDHGPGRHGPDRHGARSDTRSSVIHEAAEHSRPVVHHS